MRSIGLTQLNPLVYIKEDINVIPACLASPLATPASAKQTWRKVMHNSYGQLNDVICNQEMQNMVSKPYLVHINSSSKACKCISYHKTT
jgi:hypothetical protein